MKGIKKLKVFIACEVPTNVIAEVVCFKHSHGLNIHILDPSCMKLCFRNYISINVYACPTNNTRIPCINNPLTYMCDINLIRNNKTRLIFWRGANAHNNHNNYNNINSIQTSMTSMIFTFKINITHENTHLRPKILIESLYSYWLVKENDIQYTRLIVELGRLALS